MDGAKWSINLPKRALAEAVGQRLADQGHRASMEGVFDGGNGGWHVYTDASKEEFVEVIAACIEEQPDAKAIAATMAAGKRTA